MIGSIRTLITLPIVFFLFMAYTPTDSGMGNTIISTSMVRPLASLKWQLSPTGVNGCPGRLNTCHTPQSLRLAYGIDSLIQKGFTGKGQTVIDLVSFGSPTLQQDMAVFDQAFNLPPVNLQVISPLNIPKQGVEDQTGWAQETELDVQVIHALAPDAKIIVLQSPVSETQGTVGLPEYRQLEQYIIDNRLGNIVSQSWGASELTLQDAQGQLELQKWDALLKQGAVTNHITYFSASGDSGAADAIDARNTLSKVPTTSFAPDSPWVTSVGGTHLQRRGSTFVETAWSDRGDGSGSGGGFSHFFQMPSYQKLLPVGAQQQFGFANRRGVPDVSADADPATGMAIYYKGRWGLGGGTSASAPVWAAIQAIANQVAGRPLGFINPGLYKLGVSATYQQDFHDITQGTNANLTAGVKGYTATTGWDPVTGLGSPNAERLIPDLIAALK